MSAAMAPAMASRVSTGAGWAAIAASTPARLAPRSTPAAAPPISTMAAIVAVALVRRLGLHRR